MIQKEVGVVKSGFLTLDEISRLFSLLKENEVTEFSLDRGDEKISLKRGSSGEHSGGSGYDDLRSISARVGRDSDSGSELGTQVVGSNNGPISSKSGATKLPDSVGGEQGSQGAERGHSAHVKEVRSPMVGTFFIRPAPDSQPFVNVGDHVTKGQVLCIIEAMKVMNEVESDVTGRVVAILLDEGQVVEFEEAIFLIDPGM